ncbi:putative zinc-binding oxidoreductase [Amniculicola lignicola CBS 123094]|uniref:Putative zinc-binding oxidoreductase n=1 Tax=Amniculicola lignicola CBS 123094 TaxID=1392246 RepID=A0A6A5X4Q4_9PLEO|nr:putative zinc-binding oxidoreductase [Amniculicola lignicola CBS 123094]
MTTMRAVVMHEPGAPSVLKLENIPIPTPKDGQVLIRVRASGLNRSELFTRQGHSPGIEFPRVLGIEACGTVASAPGSSEFQEGNVVATVMGGMGRQFDGGYAEYTVVPASQVQKLTISASDLDSKKNGVGWEMLGAAPEMLQTAYGSLVKSLRIKQGDRLLVRGGTTSVGLAATAIVKGMEIGVQVMSSTRSLSREAMLKDGGADEVIVDDGNIAKEVRKIWPEGVDKVLELVGVTTLDDSLKCTKEGGVVCMTGIVGNKWSYLEYNPMEHIPSGVYLTVYSGEPDDFMKTPLNELVVQMMEGKLKIPIGKVVGLEEAAEAHTLMEENNAGGKVVFVM